MNIARTASLRRPRSLLLLILFLVGVVGISTLIGILTAPGEWYAALEKPPFNPPSWLFAPVWTLLYICIAIAGWRTWLAEGGSRGMTLWGAQMLLNWAWTPVFFALHMLWPAFVVIILMLMAIVSFIAERWNRDRIAAWLFLPYAAWVSFATLLNGSIAWLN